MLFDIALVLGAVALLAVAFFLITRKKGTTTAPKPITPSPSISKLDKGKSKKEDDVVVQGPPITILFGSQSGTAETFAYELAKEAKTHKFNPKVVDLEEYEHEKVLPGEKFVCFLLATFGEGEPTDSAQKFYEWIMNDERADDTVKGVDFAVFGLGNRQYEHFCAMGRRVSKRMKDLGGRELLPAGEGDDDGSLEDDYGTWKKAFWAAASAKFGGSDSKESSEPPKFESSFRLEMREFGQDSKDDDADDFVVVDSTPEKLSGLVMDHKHNGDFVPVLDNYELRQDSSSGSTRHIVLDLSNAPFTFRTADNIGVCPRNDFKLAAKMAKRLGVHTKSTFVLHPRATGAQKLPFPPDCSVHDALLWYCDLTSVPKRSLLETLASFATDAADKARLMSWCTDAKAAFHEDQKNLLEVLEECPSVKPPFEAFLEFVPKLVPRFYTIASSARVDPTKCVLTVAVTRSDKPRGRVHQGVCSTFLASLVPGKDRVPLFVRASTFRPPWAPAQTGHTPVLSALPAPGSAALVRSRSESKVHDAEMPVIMIGPGTGIAPFRGFLEEAKHLKQAGVKLGKMYLYFGCQKRDRDYIYKDELNEYVREGVCELITAFSRETAKKVYVQHRLEEQAAQVWDILEKQKGYIYLCGGTSMGRDVRNVLTELIKKHGNKSEADAKEYINTLQTSGRFIQELWS